MSFMDPQIDEGEWVEVDGPMGTDYIPADLVDVAAVKRWAASESPWAPAKLLKLLGDYTENREVYRVEVYHGYGVRLSAAGYMDCTPWEVYRDRADAEARYAELEEEESGEGEGDEEGEG